MKIPLKYQKIFDAQAAEIEDLKKRNHNLQSELSELKDMEHDITVAGKLSIPETTKVEFGDFHTYWENNKLIVTAIYGTIVVQPRSSNCISITGIKQ